MKKKVDYDLKPGRKLATEWNGKRYEVTVATEGFTYKGKAYETLTAIAKAITKWPAVSGPRFFGLELAMKKRLAVSVGASKPTKKKIRKALETKVAEIVAKATKPAKAKEAK